MAQQQSPAKLTDFRVLAFDVYGTLVDWESGMINALEPGVGPALVKEASVKGSPAREKILRIIHELEAAQQVAHPDMLYGDVLAAIYPQLVARLTDGGDAGAAAEGPSEDQAKAARDFGASVPCWPAFPDTVAALRRLSKHYKLVVLSNVDRESFEGTNAGPLEGVKFDMILTAQDIGSYKPDLKNFRYMLDKVESEFGAEVGGKERVLQTAQSQFHDHQPAKKVGVKSAWIVRPGAVMGNVDSSGGGDKVEEIWDFKFDTLGEMADALEREL